MELIDIHTLSERTNLSVASLQHVVAHQLVDDRTWFIPEHEHQEEMFDEVTAVLVACAARLLQSGCTEESTKFLLKWACLVPKSGRNSLNLPAIASGLMENLPAVIQLGDGSHVRVKVGRISTDWHQVSEDRAVPDDSFEPTVVTAIDVAIIRDAVTGR